MPKARQWLCALCAHWKWGAGAVVALAVFAAFVWRESIAEFFGYAAVVTEKVKGDGAAETVKEITTSSPGGRFLRDFLIALTALVVIVIAAFRSYALFIQSKVATDNFRLAEKRLLDERFATAAELMAKENQDGKPAIPARISGMHIMEKLAISAPGEFALQVVKNLMAYVKEHTQLTAVAARKKDGTLALVRTLGEDVKTAFAVLHNIFSNEKAKAEINFTLWGFSEQNFSRLNFSRSYANLSHYKNWIGANLESSFLVFADLKAANLSLAVLRNAGLGEAALTEAILKQADLSHAHLTKADLSYADMTGANLQNADLHGAKFHKAKLINADLRGAKYDKKDLAGADLTGAKMGDSKDA